MDMGVFRVRFGVFILASPPLRRHLKLCPLTFFRFQENSLKMKQKTLQSTYTTRRKIFSRNGEQTERNGSKAGATFHLTNLEAN